MKILSLKRRRQLVLVQKMRMQIRLMGTLLNPTREDVNARSPHNQASYITCCVSCFHINLNMKPNNHDLFAIVQGEILLKQLASSLLWCMNCGSKLGFTSFQFIDHSCILIINYDWLSFAIIGYHWLSLIYQSIDQRSWTI